MADKWLKLRNQLDEVFKQLGLFDDVDRSQLITTMMDEYVKRHNIPQPDPIQVILEKMVEKGLTRKDLETSIGGRSRISEVLNYKRLLNLTMIRKVSRVLEIPVDLLIKEYSLKE